MIWPSQSSFHDDSEWTATKSFRGLSVTSRPTRKSPQKIWSKRLSIHALKMRKRKHHSIEISVNVVGFNNWRECLPLPVPSQTRSTTSSHPSLAMPLPRKRFHLFEVSRVMRGQRQLIANACCMDNVNGRWMLILRKATCCFLEQRCGRSREP
jgi:hypothetical protein